MQTTVTAKQIGHFAEFGWIEFAGFLSPDECIGIREIAVQALSGKLKVDSKKLMRYDLYLEGRDLWRHSSALQKILCQERFVSTVMQLTNKRYLQVICDQWIPPGQKLEPLRLNDHISFQNTVCGCLMILDGPLAGNVRFFSPARFPLVLEQQLLVVYGTTQSVYVHNPLDPTNCALKQFGYSFGDRLNADHHLTCKNHS